MSLSGAGPAPLGPDNPFVAFPKSEIEQSIPDRFEQQVRRHADRVAADTVDGTLTYAALNRAANRLARTLLAQLGGRPEPVAFLLGHGASPLVAILGILKAGKCYVPLDPTWPEARIAAMLDDSQARRIVTDREHLPPAKRLATKARRPIDLAAIARRTPAEDLGLPIAPDAPASLLYTSGSTGRPKGILQTHRNVLHNVMKYTNGLHISASDRLSLLPRSSYGASVSDIFGALLNGAALLPFDLKQQGTDRLAAWLIDREVTIYHSVATVFRRLVAGLTPQTRFPKLRLIKLGGEPVTRRDVQLYQQHFQPGCILHVGYGATETNILRQYFIRTDTQLPGDIVPVGYPVDDTDIVLLDPSGSEVAPGSIGEIAVRSAYLPPGYWRREDLTAAAFQAVPGGGGLRIYRTGDLGRMLPDGCLLHLGRKDSEVKVRGHRVDLLEIEAALAGLPNVRQACVVARQGRGEAAQLVAYVVPSSGRAPAAGALRQALAKTLPDFMLPSAILVRRDLPETPTGKVDRQALAALAWHPSRPQTAYAAPRTSLEELLVATWCEVLGIERLGIRDNFFDLGGHSLLAAQLFAQIEKVLGVRLPMTSLLQAPTVEALAGVVGRRPPWAAAALVPIQRAGSRPPFYCVHGADGYVLKFYTLANLLGPDQPFYGLQARGVDGAALPRTSIEAMALAYLREIRAVQPDGPYFLGGYSLGGLVALEMARQLGRQGARVGLLALLDTSYPQARRRVPLALPVSGRLTFPQSRDTSGKHWHSQWHTRVWGRLHSAGRSLRWLAAGCALPIASRLGRTVPQRSREFWFREARRRALRQYVLQAYPGRITYFLAEDSDRHKTLLSWRALAEQGLDLRIVGGNHATFFFPEHARRLAAALAASLAEAQASCLTTQAASVPRLRPVA